MNSRIPDTSAGRWEFLGVFGNDVRVEIVRLLLESDFRSLSEVAIALSGRGWKMTLSGVLKHMRELERAGLVRHEPGIFGKVPDARKTIYFLEGRERVEKILKNLDEVVREPMEAGLVFHETNEVARSLQSTGRGLIEGEKQRLESLLSRCESQRIFVHLSEDEKKKLKLWRMMLSVI